MARGGVHRAERRDHRCTQDVFPIMGGGYGRSKNGAASLAYDLGQPRLSSSAARDGNAATSAGMTISNDDQHLRPHRNHGQKQRDRSQRQRLFGNRANHVTLPERTENIVHLMFLRVKAGVNEPVCRTATVVNAGRWGLMTVSAEATWLQESRVISPRGASNPIEGR